MADTYQYVAGHTYKLYGSGITSVSTSITLIDFTDIYGNSLTMADFGTIGHLVLEPKTTKTEIISFTGVTVNGDGTSTLTGVTRGLKAKAPYDAGGFGDSHSGGSIAIISNPPQLYDKISNKANDEVVAGVWTFTEPNVPRLDATHAYVAGEELLFATKEYADNLSFAGAPDGTTTSKGIFEEATLAEIDAGTAAGSTAARLAVNPSSLALSIYATRLPTANEKAALVGTSGTPVSGANKLVDNADTTGTGSVIRQSVIAAANNDVYGDGSDGDITVTSGAFSSGPITSNALTRDAYFNNLTINNTFTLNPNGYRIFVKGTLTTVGTGKVARNGNNGTVGDAGGGAIGGLGGGGGAGGGNGGAGGLIVVVAKSIVSGSATSIQALGGNAGAGGAGGIGGNGNVGSGGVGGAAGAGGAALSAGSISGAVAGVAGSAGGSGGASSAGVAGTVGTNGGDLTNAIGSAGVAGSVGGLGGGGAAGGAAGTAGTVTNPAVMPRTVWPATWLHTFTDSAIAFMNGSAQAGGAGGGGGGVGLAFNNSGGAGGAGGSGGTGGVLVLIYQTMTGTAITSAAVAGGSAGAGGAGAAGTGTGVAGAAGTAGVAGASGVIYSLVIS